MTIEGSSAREHLLAAARVRLRQVGATGDLTVLRTPSARADLEALLALFADGRRDVEVGYRLGWLLLLNGLGDGDEALIDTMADGFALCLLAGVEDLPADLLPAIASVAEEVAGALLDQAMSSADRALLDLAVEQHRRLVKATPADHAGRPERLHRLGNALHRRFEFWHAEEDLTAALAAHRESIDITPRGGTELSIRLSGLAGVLWSRHRLKGDTADLDAAVDTVRAAGDMAPAGSSHRAMCLSNLGLTLRDRFARGGDPADLDEAIAAGRQAWELTPPDDPYRSQRLQNLVGHLVIRYRKVEGAEAMAETVTGLSATAPADLAMIAFLAGSDDIPDAVASDVARLAAGLTIGRSLHMVNVYDPVAHEAVVALWRRILRITPAGDPERHIYLANVSSVLLFRHRTTGAPSDLEAVLETARRAVRAAPEGDPDRVLGLGNLAASLKARHRVEGAAEDLELAVDVLRDATDRLPHSHVHRARLLSDLGGVLAELFRLHEDPADLDDAVAALRDSTRSVPGDPMGPGLALSNLGESLHVRYTRTGAQDDLEEAITTLRVAVEATPPEHSSHVMCLRSLGAALTGRFERSGTRRDLDEAIRVLRAAVAAAPTGSLERTRSLVNLAHALHRRLHTADSRPEDADEAVALARDALAGAPAGSALQRQCHSHLLNALQVRFDRHGKPDDLAEAAALGRELLHSTPDAAPADQNEWLSAGAMVLRDQYAFSGSSSDLDAAIDAQRTALAEVGPTSPNRAGALHALGGYLRARHVLLGTRADLDEAIDILAAAAGAAPPGHPERPMILSTRCKILLLRAEATEAAAAVADDVDTAVAIAQEAVDALGDRSPRRQQLLDQFGQALLFRYRTKDSPTDLHAALAVLRQAEGIAADGVNRLIVLQHLVEALQARIERYGDPADLDTAVDLSAQLVSSPVAPPVMRLNAALTASGLVARDDPARATDFCETAVELFPHIAPRRLRRAEQQRFLGWFAGLAPNAAAVALSEPGGSAEERAARALRLLETGRGVLIGQALDAWSDLAPLRARHPELAARFEELRDLLDRPDDGADALLGGFTLPGPEGAATVDRHRLADEFTTVLARIRQSEGFATFGLPPSVEELRSAARDGTVVVLNVTVLRCDALLVTRGGITSVPLPGLTLENGTQAGVACLAHAHESTAPDENLRAKAQEELSGILAWLWDVVAEPVLTALGHDHAPADGALPRVWWVPCGPLALLPFHAAGYHDGSGRAVLDRVVSSCSPTVRALHHARRPLPAAPAPGRPLVVAMPTTPGLSPLDFAADEAEVFEEHMGPATVLLAPERPPTRDGVLALLPGSPVVHFACHGDSWDEDPSRHRLLLHDHADTPLTVEALASVRLDHARLAYLSACETAVSYDGQLADEAIHLTSAFQLCGFRHVIGTLWPVLDDLAVEMADAFYSGLRHGIGAPDPDRSPYALHTAVRELRARLPHAPSLWASHVHSGA